MASSRAQMGSSRVTGSAMAVFADGPAAGCAGSNEPASPFWISDFGFPTRAALAEMVRGGLGAGPVSRRPSAVKEEGTEALRHERHEVWNLVLRTRGTSGCFGHRLASAGVFSRHGDSPARLRRALDRGMRCWSGADGALPAARAFGSLWRHECRSRDFAAGDAGRCAAGGSLCTCRRSTGGGGRAQGRGAPGARRGSRRSDPGARRGLRHTPSVRAAGTSGAVGSPANRRPARADNNSIAWYSILSSLAFPLVQKSRADRRAGHFH